MKRNAPDASVLKQIKTLKKQIQHCKDRKKRQTLQAQLRALQT